MSQEIEMSQELIEPLIRSDPSNHSDESESEASSNHSDEFMSASSNHSDESESKATLNPMSLEIQLVPSLNHSDEYESLAFYRRPLTHLPDDREKYFELGLPLYAASIRCDWKAAEYILDKNPDMNLLRCSISENGDTALHIAASAIAPKKKVVEFVKNLVERMTPEDLALVNNNQNTALYLAAAAGNIETVEIMMDKTEFLDTIPGGGGAMMPLYAAVLFGNEDVARYLYERSQDLRIEGWNPENRSSLLEKCVESDMFDIAKEIVYKHTMLGRSTNLLGHLARKPEAFYEKSGDALQLLRILWGDIVKLPKNDRDRILRGPPDSTESALIFHRLDELEVEASEIIKKGTQEVPKLKDLVSKYVVDMHVETQRLIKQENTINEDQALDLQKHISEFIVKLHDETRNMPANGDVSEYEGGDVFEYDGGDVFEYEGCDDFEYQGRPVQRLLNLIFDHIKKMRAEIKILADTRSYSSRVLFIAAEVGNTKFLLELIRVQPDLIWQVDDNGLTIFHIAVKHRHAGIYNLLYQIGSMKDMVTPLTDKDGNNMLHLVAMRTRNKNLEDVSGAALQMQQELLWFEEVERMIPPSLRVRKNKDGFTPRELFTMEHQYLIEPGEKWMKETASQCMVVAALIATMVFAAAFTVPGGYNQNDGIPMFNRKLSFAVFVVADAMSFFYSSISILTFLSFFTSRYAERDFIKLLPLKLMLGLISLIASIETMMVTFSVSFFVLYHKEMKWIPIFSSGFAVLPVILYVMLQFHLLVDVFRSTYGGKYLFKPETQVLFYENPKV